MAGGSESVREVIESEKGKEVVVMDTPDRSKTQIAASISKFEDSPVFNFLNDLSPIMTANSVPITQTMNNLSFASLPTVFTSAYVSFLKESRFLRSESNIMTDEGIMDTGCDGNEQHKIIKSENSVDVVSVERFLECSQPTVGNVQQANYNFRSPICQTNNSSKFLPFCNFDAISRQSVPFAQFGRENGLYGNEAHTEELNPGIESGGASGCYWQAISDVADMLTFESPVDVEADASMKSLAHATGIYKEITNDLQKVQPLGSVRFREDNETNNPSTQPEEGCCRKELTEMQDMLADSSLGTNYIDGSLEHKMNIEAASHFYRGVRKRCLDFDVAGARRKHLDESSSAVFPVFSPSGVNTLADDKKHIVPTMARKDSKCVLPGIGLHLNALAANAKEYKCVTKIASASGRVFISSGSNTTDIHSSEPDDEQQNTSMQTIYTEGHTNPGENEVLLSEDIDHSSVHIKNEELNQRSPERKRCRLEHTEEVETACKRCNCKKSKCLKLYCECFAASVYCVEPCSCQECFNQPIHEEIVLAARKHIEFRDPAAFEPKVVRSSDSQAEMGEDSSRTPASARHKRGCNCKKSGCLKKYCECYQGGVGCSINCRCQGCQNAFGRKNVKEEQIVAIERSFKYRCSSIHTDGENVESTPQVTPFQFKRPSLEASISSTKPASYPIPSHGLMERQDFLPLPKFEKQPEMVFEDEMPMILQGKGSSLVGIKSSSPNSKRVFSPHPHSDLGTSFHRRSSRKLILQAVTSFPNLTPEH